MTTTLISSGYDALSRRPRRAEQELTHEGEVVAARSRRPSTGSSSAISTRSTRSPIGDAEVNAPDDDRRSGLQAAGAAAAGGHRPARDRRGHQDQLRAGAGRRSGGQHRRGGAPLSLAGAVARAGAAAAHVDIAQRCSRRRSRRSSRATWARRRPCWNATTRSIRCVARSSPPGRRHAADAGRVPSALELMLIARHLERIGDHATNIAEDVFFVVAGEDIRHQMLGDTRSEERVERLAQHLRASAPDDADVPVALEHGERDISDVVNVPVQAQVFHHVVPAEQVAHRQRFIERSVADDDVASPLMRSPKG